MSQPSAGCYPLLRSLPPDVRERLRETARECGGGWWHSGPSWHLLNAHTGSSRPVLPPSPLDVLRVAAKIEAHATYQRADEILLGYFNNHLALAVIAGKEWPYVLRLLHRAHDLSLSPTDTDAPAHKWPPLRPIGGC